MRKHVVTEKERVFHSDSGKKYSSLEILGRGGNGVVYKVTDGTDIFALKTLKPNARKDKEKFERFQNEIYTLKKYKGYDNVMSLIDKNETDEFSFYVMPIGIDSLKYLKDKLFEDKILCIVKMARALQALAKNAIFHRDIKPQNIIYIDGVPYLSDFGLAKTPFGKDLTKNNKGVGPIWTIAPEMKRTPETADAERGDVYSLAKTLWILITGELKGFEGEYSSGRQCSLINYGIKNPSYLEDIIKPCTSDIPQNRLTYGEIIRLLTALIGNNGDALALKEWAALKKRIFPENTPVRSQWARIQEIQQILKLITVYCHRNHTYFPGGGGLDLSGVTQANEEECLELSFSGSAYICKPKTLDFFSIDESGLWDYFILNLHEMPKIFKVSTSNIEEVLEIEPLKYTNRSYYDFGYFNGNRIDNSKMRIVSRIISGKIAIFFSASPYGDFSDSYDALHEKMTNDELYFFLKEQLMQKEWNNKNGKREISYDESYRCVITDKISSPEKKTTDRYFHIYLQ